MNLTISNVEKINDTYLLIADGHQIIFDPTIFTHMPIPTVGELIGMLVSDKLDEYNYYYKGERIYTWESSSMEVPYKEEWVSLDVDISVLHKNHANIDNTLIIDEGISHGSIVDGDMLTQQARTIDPSLDDNSINDKNVIKGIRGMFKW